MNLVTRLLTAIGVLRSRRLNLSDVTAGFQRTLNDLDVVIAQANEEANTAREEAERASTRCTTCRSEAIRAESVRTNITKLIEGQ